MTPDTMTLARRNDAAQQLYERRGYMPVVQS